MKIGVLGGTFDPPHSGHLALARAAMEALELDEVLFVPAGRNPLKQNKHQTIGKHRLEMVKLALRNEPNMTVSDIELGRSGPSYTIDTISELSYLRPAEYWFILGADALRELPKWKHPEKLLRICRFAAVLRSPQTKELAMAGIPEDLHGRVDWIPMTAVSISSSELRIKIEEGKPGSPWIDPKVQEYIEKNKLYRS